MPTVSMGGFIEAAAVTTTIRQSISGGALRTRLGSQSGFYNQLIDSSLRGSDSHDSRGTAELLLVAVMTGLRRLAVVPLARLAGIRRDCDRAAIPASTKKAAKLVCNSRQSSASRRPGGGRAAAG